MDPVLLSIRDGIAKLRFNRPDRLNALDLAMTEAFQDAVAQIASDRSVKVVVLSGEGRAFVAGGDLAFLRSAANRAEAARKLITPIHNGLKTLREQGLLTVATVHGPAAGAGMSLTLASDFVVASDQATFNMAYVRIAASPDCGGSWALTRLVGARRALELALLGDTLTASEALQMGLINKVVSAADLARETDSLAERLALLPSGAAIRTRSLIDVAFTTAFSDHLDLEREAFATGAADSEFDEALDAFFTRRAPVFVGDRLGAPTTVPGV